MDSDGALTVGLIMVIGVVTILCISSGSCDISKTDSMRILSSEGVSNVQLSGYQWFECGRDDTFSQGFQGNKNGHQVQGVLCSGWLKGITVRYK